MKNKSPIDLGKEHQKEFDRQMDHIGQLLQHSQGLSRSINIDKSKIEGKTLEEIHQIVENAWQDLPKPERDIEIMTGKGGAILAYQWLLGRDLTQEEKDSLPIGAYRMSTSDKNYITYLG